MRVAKWGNSLAVRLPARMVKELNLVPGDEIEVRIAGQRRLEIERVPSPIELLHNLRRLRGRLPANIRVNRLEAHEGRD